MASITKNFLKGIMNKDNDEIVLEDGVIRHGLNIDIVHSEGSDAGLVRNRKGNTLIGSISDTAGQLIQNCRTIGATASETDNLLYYFIASDKFDGIYEFNESTGLIHRIVQSNKSTPSTPSKLNFNQSYYITGVNFIDGFLYWTDDFNPPRRVNISRVRAYAVDDDRIDDDISVIIAPPLHAPTIKLLNEEDQENNMKEKFLQFSHRYKNIDNQYSAMSPWSGVAFEPDNYELDYGAGENKAMLNSKNRVEVSFSTGNQFIEEIELLVRDTKSKNVLIVESFNKEQLNIDNNSIFSYKFSNNKTNRTLKESELGRLFDNVPLKAKAQEVIDRRIIYGNYEQSYDIANSLGEKIAIDYTVKHVSKETPLEEPIQTFRSDRDLEVGIQYGEGYGRFSTILTSPTSSSTTYIPPQKSITGNSLVVDINNKPPDFATHFRLSIKQSKGKYYNIFPILYYAHGMYRYFLVNEFDKDKIKVGEYVIFKQDVTGATLKNERYKILEFGLKSSNFLGTSTSQTELPGLYFKIKVEDNSSFNPNDIYNESWEAKGSNYRDPVTGPSALPVLNRFTVAEKAIHYGVGNENSFTVNNSSFIGNEDRRYSIKILSPTTFTWTYDINPTTGSWSAPINIVFGTPMVINAFTATFNNTYPLEINDQWKVNCRYGGSLTLTGNIFGGAGLPSAGVPISDGAWGGAAVLPGASWSPTTSPETDREIKSGAVITIDIIYDTANPAQQAAPQQFPPSPMDYANLEEWFIESGAYNSFIFNKEGVGNIGAEVITFRRGNAYTNIPGSGVTSGVGYIDQGSSISQSSLSYPVHMIIQGVGYSGLSGGNVDEFLNKIKASINIQQTENLAQCETIPEENDADIFHETTKTYSIKNGLHKVLWDYQDFTYPSYATVDGIAYTNLGQLIPGSTPDGIDPHTFQVGDQVEVHTSSSPYASIQGTHTIVHVEDMYNIVIDLPAPGAGATTGGSIGFYHQEMEESDQSNSGATARILINPTTNTNSTFNAYAFGNGLESDRIRDNFNSTTIEYSPRASTIIEGYKKERKESSLTYSGTYQDKTSTNGLNEFNYSLVNFKNLDIEFGSVQKLFARDTDIIVFQEDKISKVLYGKNLWSDATGGGTIGVTPEVLGTQIPDKGEWGISFNPESFAKWGEEMYWTDSRRGSVLSMNGQGIAPISDQGMSSYFRDLMKDNPNTQKIGVFDPHDKSYILSSNEKTSRPCALSLSSYGRDYPSNILDWPGVISKYGEDFIVSSNSSWTAEITYSDGADWVSNFPLSGSGSENVFLNIENNTTLTVRVATITFTYCDGAEVSYVITQAAGPRLQVHPWVLNNKK